MADGTGLRERKKRETREALRSAALRLAAERGPDNVRVDDIAAAAGVSPRTYNNYYSSREQAIVAGVTAERDERVAAAIAATPADARLADAVGEAIVAEYSEPGERAQKAMMLIATNHALRVAYLEEAGTLEGPLATVFGERFGGKGRGAARVLAAAVAGAVRIALEGWLQAQTGSREGGLVIVSGGLPEALRATLAVLAPALDAADKAYAGST